MTDKPTLTQKLILPSVFDLIVMTVFVTMIIADPMIKSFDIFWHLRTGGLMLSGIFPLTDIFSYTAYGKPWILHEWGSQVIFAFVHNTAGFSGLIVLKSLIFALIYGLMFKLMLKKNINIFVSLFFAIFLVFGTANGWTVRPHMFTYLFLVLLFWIFFEFNDRGNQKILWAMPVLFLFWINLHGGFVIGFVVLAGCIGAHILTCFLKTGPAPKVACSRAKQLILWGMGSFAVCFLNPNTYKGVLYPLMYLGEQMDSKFIQEWAVPTMQTDINFFVYTMLIILGLAFSKKKPELYEIVLLMVFTFFVFSARRHLPVFSIVVLPLIAVLWQDCIISFYKTLHTQAGKAFQQWLNPISNYFTTRSEWFSSLEKHLRFHTILFIVVGIMSGLSVAAPEKLGIGLDSSSYPIEVMDHVKSNNLQGNIFNQYAWGGFMLWALPEHKVFIDGRMDVYKREISDPYKTIINLETGWESLIDEYDIRHILVKKQTRIALFLRHVSDEWFLEKETENACLFSRR